MVEVASLADKRFTPFDFLIVDSDVLADAEERFSSFVYVLQHGDGGPVKIGCGSSVIGRAKAMQTGSPVEIFIRAAVFCGPRHNLEHQAHKEATKYRLRGEWFDLSVLEAVEIIQRAAAEKNIDILPVSESHAPLVPLYGQRPCD